MAIYPKERGGWKVDDEKLKVYVTKNPDAYQAEIAEAIGVKENTVCRALKRLNISRKKDSTVMERDETKRDAYSKEIEEYPKEKRIYLDESGFCHRLQRNHGYAP